MFSPDLIQRLAAELHPSEKTRVQVEHFSKRFPGMRIEDGCASSRAWVAIKIAEGRVAKGHKIGLGSRAMQQASVQGHPAIGVAGCQAGHLGRMPERGRGGAGRLVHPACAGKSGRCV